MTHTLTALDIYDSLMVLFDLVKGRHEQVDTWQSLKGKPIATLRSITATKTPDAHKPMAIYLDKGDVRQRSTSAHETILFKAQTKEQIKKDRIADVAPYWDPKIQAAFEKTVALLKTHPAFGPTSSLTVSLGQSGAGRPTFVFYPEGIIPESAKNLVTRDKFLLRLDEMLKNMDTLATLQPTSDHQLYVSYYGALMTAKSPELAALKKSLLDNPATPENATAGYGEYTLLTDHNSRQEAANTLTQAFKQRLHERLEFHHVSY